MLTKAVQHSKNSNIVKFKITIQSNRFLFEYIFKCNLFLWRKAVTLKTGVMMLKII